MSQPARLSLRAPPHLPFVQGYPGIPDGPNRCAPSVDGTLELRVGYVPVKAKWVRVELRKFECLPSGRGFPVAAVEESRQVVGSIQTLWKPPSNGKEWDTIQTADFKFSLSLPLDIPPSVELSAKTESKHSGVRYELVAALCYKQKGGVFKKESASVVVATEPISIIKYELLSAWPVYSIPEVKTIKSASGSMEFTVTRACIAFCTNDQAHFGVILKSLKPQPIRLVRYECTILEITTYLPPPPDPSSKHKKSKKPLGPMHQIRIIQTMNATINETLRPGEEKSARIPYRVEDVRASVTSAKILKVQYEMEVRAVLEGVSENVMIKGLKCIVGPFPKENAEQTVRSIGQVMALCPEASDISCQPEGQDSFPGKIPTSNLNTSPSSFGMTPTQPTQGFIPRNFRRQSSLTSSTTDISATETTVTHEFGGNVGIGGYRTMPLRQPDIVFPSPHPHRPSSTSPVLPKETPTQNRHSMGDAGSSDENWRRYSTGTNATFGKKDFNIATSIRHQRATSDITQSPTTPTNNSRLTAAPTPPSAYSFQSAEQEKHQQQQLYNEARKNAARVQEASGTSLDRLGLTQSTHVDLVVEDAKVAQDGKGQGDVPPPEYAPPRPMQPAKYTAPTRSVSAYTECPKSRHSESSKVHLSTTSTPSPPLPSTKTSGKEVHMTVAQEKEITFLASSGLSSMSEKEQMRRYYEAQDKAKQYNKQRDLSEAKAEGEAGPSNSLLSRQNQTNEGGVDGQAGPSTPRGRPLNGSSVTGLHAIDEKEQIKLYYEAQERVAAAVGGGGSDDVVIYSPSTPVTSDSFASAFSTPNVKNEICANSQNKIHKPSSARSNFDHNKGQVSRLLSTSSAMDEVPDIIDEKEQMRLYYEAQERVARAFESEINVGISTSRVEVSDPPENTKSQEDHPTTVETLYGKGQMESYETQNQVTVTTRDDNNDYHAAAQQAAMTVTVPSYPSPSAPASSALSEKEQVRRYYEAQEAVAKATDRGEGSSSQIYSSSKNDVLPLSDGHAISNVASDAFLFAKDETAHVYGSFRAAQPIAQGAVFRRSNESIFLPQPTVGYDGYQSQVSLPLESPLNKNISVETKKDRVARQDISDAQQSQSTPVGPPPPLPAKPPKEYIDLLNHL
nr:hypothetical protein L203_00267 [Cryptococcus depauperatus CBS 7841]